MNYREDLEELRRRMNQNVRHLNEMEWARFNGIGGQPAADVHDDVLRAENVKFRAAIDKLEKPSA